MDNAITPENSPFGTLLMTMARLVSVLLAVNVSFCVRSRRRPRILIQQKRKEKKKERKFMNHEEVLRSVPQISLTTLQT